MWSGWSGGGDLKEESGIVAVTEVGEEGCVRPVAAEIDIRKKGRKMDEKSYV